MVRFLDLCSGHLATKTGRCLATLAAAILIAVSPSGDAAAQAEPVYDTWTNDCQAETGCIVYFATSGLQIFIGPDATDDRTLAVFRISVFSVPDTPVAILLDNDWLASLDVAECDEDFCRFIIDVTDDPTVIDQFKTASTGSIAYVINEGADLIIVPFHLNGFTAAYNRLGQ